MNKELKYLVSICLESVQLIDVLAPYTQDLWQMEVQDILFDGVDAIKFWHICSRAASTGSATCSRKGGKNDVALQDIEGRRYPHGVHQQRLRRARRFQGVSEGQGARNRRRRCKKYSSRNAGADRRAHQERARGGSRRIGCLVAPDCGLGYFSRTVAYAKLRAMGEATRQLRKKL